MSVAAPLQRRFTFADLGSCRPLLNVNAVMALLDLDEDAVLYLIEDGQLGFAFNIADAGAGARELRIWKGALARMTMDQGSRSKEEPELDEVISAILPPALDLGPRTLGLGSGATLRVEPDLTRAFNCSATHVNDLIGQKELQEVVNPNRKATQTRVVTRASVALFLERRRMI